MNKRTTFALDDGTVRRLRRLADFWQISQSETVRRALEKAENDALREADARIARLQKYHAGGGLSAEQAQAYMAEITENRTSWRNEK